MTYNELIRFLGEIGASPQKRLSQNFLIDQNVVQKIVQVADVRPGDVVLEIGPGPGALTSVLLEKGAIVHAIEKDPLFAKALTRLQTKDARLNVYLSDALEFPFKNIPFQKVIANLPYHITTPLLEKCFNSSFSSITVMVQKEVADRIFAREGTKTFGSLSLFTRYYARLESQFTVSPNCFYPKPSVASSVIHLCSYPLPEVSPSRFFPMMRHAFTQRRKCLSTSLKEFAPTDVIKKVLRSICVREDARAEMLSLDNWLLLTRAINRWQEACYGFAKSDFQIAGRIENTVLQSEN